MVAKEAISQSYLSLVALFSMQLFVDVDIIYFDHHRLHSEHLSRYIGCTFACEELLSWNISLNKFDRTLLLLKTTENKANLCFRRSSRLFTQICD